MAGNGKHNDLEDVFAKSNQDIVNLETQIRKLLKTMQVAGNIESAETLELVEPPKCANENEGPEIRMGWLRTEDARRQRKGKSVSEFGQSTASVSALGQSTTKDVQDMTGFEIMELCIQEQEEVFVPVKGSVFFVPVLDKCVFGMSLLNATATNLPVPTISVSLLPAKDFRKSQRKIARSFMYDVSVTLKEISPDRITKNKSVSGVTFHDTFNRNKFADSKVMSGCEVLATATFVYPAHLLNYKNEFRLVVSVFLEGKELWAREVSVNSCHFGALNVDHVFKNHHASVLTALGTEWEGFRMERMLSPVEKTPFKSIERFLAPLGFENIATQRLGFDSTIEIYSTNQPSMLWGTTFKLEKNSRKTNAMRCAITTRTGQQMQMLFSHLNDWLWKENHRERKHGLSGLTLCPINSGSSSNFYTCLDSEIQLILRLQQVKTVLSGSMTLSGSSQLRKYGRPSEEPSLDSNWIREYSDFVAKTDSLYVEKMQ